MKKALNQALFCFFACTTSLYIAYALGSEEDAIQEVDDTDPHNDADIPALQPLSSLEEVKGETPKPEERPEAPAIIEPLLRKIANIHDKGERRKAFAALMAYSKRVEEVKDRYAEGANDDESVFV